MKKSRAFFFTSIFLTILVSGCAPAPTPVPPTFTASPIPPTFTPQPTATATATATVTATATETPMPTPDYPTITFEGDGGKTLTIRTFGKYVLGWEETLRLNDYIEHHGEVTDFPNPDPIEHSIRHLRLDAPTDDDNRAIQEYVLQTFEPFFHYSSIVDPTTGKFNITEDEIKYMLLHNGVIYVQFDAEKGSIFIISVPGSGFTKFESIYVPWIVNDGRRCAPVVCSDTPIPVP